MEETTKLPAEERAENLPDTSAQPEAKAKPAEKNIGDILRRYFTATRMAYLAIFTALSFVMYFLEFVLLPTSPVPFLKLDFSNVFVMIGGFTLGPVAGVIIAVLKEVLHGLILGQTAFVGELANVLFVLPYLLIPSIIYRKHKGIKTVLWTLAVGCVSACAVSMPVNYLLTFPAFTVAFGGTWEAGQQLFIATWYWALLFNFIKTISITAVVMLIYKPLSKLIKLTNAKFNSLKKKKDTVQK